MNAVRASKKSDFRKYAVRVPWAWVRGSIDVSKVKAVQNRLLSEMLTAYHISHRETVNPKGEPITGISAASGPNIASPLMMADPAKLLMVDLRKVDIDRLRKEKKNWCEKRGSLINRLPSAKGPFISSAYQQKHKASKWNMLQKRHDYLYWDVYDSNLFFERLVILELKMLGVRKGSIRIGRDGYGDVELRFPWAYPGEVERERTVSFLEADIRLIDNYPQQLRDTLDRSAADFFLMQASLDSLARLKWFMPRIARSIRRSVVISPLTASPRFTYVPSSLHEILSSRFCQEKGINADYEQLFSSFHLDRYSYYLELWMRSQWK